MITLFLVVGFIVLGLVLLVFGLGALLVLLTDPKGAAYGIGRAAQSVLTRFLPIGLLRRGPQRVEEAGEAKKGVWGEIWAGLLGQESPSHKTWPKTPGKILSSRDVVRWVSNTSSDGPRKYPIYATLIFYTYRVANGRQYEGNAFFQGYRSIKKAQEWVQHNPPGTEIAVRYNPERPEDSALAGLPDNPIPAKEAPLLSSLAIGTSAMRSQYPGPETDYVVQWYALHDTPAYWGSLSASNGILTCLGCSKTRSLGPCPNCEHEQQFFRTEADENWVPHSTSGGGFTPREGVEGYVRCHSCGNAWHFWICECGTRNNIRQSMGWKEHIVAENPIAERLGKTTKPTKEQ
jgi:hypothetical protein